MKLTKKGQLTPNSDAFSGTVIDRRTFLQNAGIGAGLGASASLFAPRLMERAEATTRPVPNSIEVKRTICTHCSVGCGIYAEVQNGIWVGQEPALDHPFNLGGHCAKGASIRHHGSNERRLRYPMKKVDGEWVRISWDQAIDEIGDRLLTLREAHGPDSAYWLGSAKHNNEQAYLFRKFAAFWGTNNVDHQARICHSTTVAGVANTWGYGAMTNSYNDMVNAKAIFMIGSNAAEAHPIAMQHILKAKEKGAKLIVVDPRFTRTAAHADHYLRIRPGTDVPLIWGLLWHIFENNWQDDTFIQQRVYGMEEVRKEVAKWPPSEVERVTGVDEATCKQAAQYMAEHKPGTFVWCMGGTQHTIGNNNTRAYCIFQLALGNMGVAGGGTNIFRGHDNVQGATDFGVLSESLPGYYGLADGSWKHWARVWNVDFDWIQGRFDQGEYDDGRGTPTKPMNLTGIPVSRWIDGVLEQPDLISQKTNLKAMIFWGHAPNSQVRGPEMKQAMEKLDLLVIVDPHPTVAAVMNDRQNDTYLLPATTQFETYGSVTASNRSIQWRDKLIEPLFESKPDHTIIYLFAKKFGFAAELTRNIQVINDEPLIEDIVREYNRGMWTIGYTGQSPERLKEHQQNWHTFDIVNLRAEGGPLDNEFYGLPWPCWGTPEMKHPGTANLYDTSLPVKDGGLTFRANFGVEREGVSLLAEGSWSKESELEMGYPEFTFGLMQKLGWDKDLTPEELASIQAIGGDKVEDMNWKIDLSGGMQRVIIEHGCAPFGNAKARCVVWNFPDHVPIHREPLYTSRHELVAEYPTYADRKAFWRLPTRYESIQATDFSQDFPIILTSGRLVEYEGGGDETRSNPWLAELQQHMFVEINPFDANNAGVRDGQMVWVEGPEGGRIKVKALVTRRVGRGVAFTPFHFGGHFQGRDLRPNYPQGADPVVLGESCNIAFTYGYDSVTAMQETKCSLCRILPA